MQAQQGDERAHRAFALTGTYLGIGLATLVNLFNPECIMLNGAEYYLSDLFLEPMKEALNRHIFSQLGANLKLMTEQNTSLHWARGAGCLVLRDFFSSPAQLS